MITMDVDKYNHDILKLQRLFLRKKDIQINFLSAISDDVIERTLSKIILEKTYSGSGSSSRQRNVLQPLKTENIKEEKKINKKYSKASLNNELDRFSKLLENLRKSNDEKVLKMHTKKKKDKIEPQVKTDTPAASSQLQSDSKKMKDDKKNTQKEVIDRSENPKEIDDKSSKSLATDKSSEITPLRENSNCGEIINDEKENGIDEVKLEFFPDKNFSQERHKKMIAELSHKQRTERETEPCDNEIKVLKFDDWYKNIHGNAEDTSKSNKKDDKQTSKKLSKKNREHVKSEKIVSKKNKKQLTKDKGGVAITTKEIVQSDKPKSAKNDDLFFKNIDEELNCLETDFKNEYYKYEYEDMLVRDTVYSLYYNVEFEDFLEYGFYDDIFTNYSKPRRNRSSRKKNKVRDECVKKYWENEYELILFQLETEDNQCKSVLPYVELSHKQRTERETEPCDNEIKVVKFDDWYINIHGNVEDTSKSNKKDDKLTKYSLTNSSEASKKLSKNNREYVECEIIVSDKNKERLKKSAKNDDLFFKDIDEESDCLKTDFKNEYCTYVYEDWVIRNNIYSMHSNEEFEDFLEYGFFDDIFPNYSKRRRNRGSRKKNKVRNECVKNYWENEYKLILFQLETEDNQCKSDLPYVEKCEKKTDDNTLPKIKQNKNVKQLDNRSKTNYKQKNNKLCGSVMFYSNNFSKEVQNSSENAQLLADNAKIIGFDGRRAWYGRSDTFLKEDQNSSENSQLLAEDDDTISFDDWLYKHTTFKI